MNVWLYTWNPKYFDWPGFEDHSQATQADPIMMDWSTNSRKPCVGDRAYRIRLGDTEEPGIIAAGRLDSEPFEAKHWDPRRADSGQSCWYVKVAMEHVDETPLISRDELNEIFGNRQMWSPFSSGIRIIEDVAEELVPLLDGRM